MRLYALKILCDIKKSQTNKAQAQFFAIMGDWKKLSTDLCFQGINILKIKNILLSMKSAIIIKEPLYHASEHYGWDETKYGGLGVGVAEEYIRGTGDLVFHIKRFKKQYKINKQTFRNFVNADRQRRVQEIKGRRIGIIPISLLTTI